MLNNSVLNYYSNNNIDNINYNSKYDFKGECYNSLYPNLHKCKAAGTWTLVFSLKSLIHERMISRECTECVMVQI